MTRLAPVRACEFLKHNFMNPPDLAASWPARAIGASAARANEIIRDRRGMTAETAPRMARYFNTGAQVG